jgi:hypothetical protein
MQASLQKKIQKEDQLKVERRRLFESQVSVSRKSQYAYLHNEVPLK